MRAHLLLWKELCRRNSLATQLLHSAVPFRMGSLNSKCTNLLATAKTPSYFTIFTAIPTEATCTPFSLTNSAPDPRGNRRRHVGLGAQTNIPSWLTREHVRLFRFSSPLYGASSISSLSALLSARTSAGQCRSKQPPRNSAATRWSQNVRDPRDSCSFRCSFKKLPTVPFRCVSYEVRRVAQISGEFLEINS